MEQLFNLPEQIEIPENVSEQHVIEVTQTAITNLEKIENALPQVKGLEAADAELDDIAELATNSFNDLKDLGMNVEAKYSPELFNAAGVMLGHALAAKTAKISKKLKMIELQLRKATLDQKQAQKEEQIMSLPVGEGKIALDRNEFLKNEIEKTKDQ